ncbi:MAG: type 1 glutamine amidotransferase [Methylophilaceae bacterium]
MKPVVIFRHALTEGAGYLSSYLEENEIPWHLVKIDQGDAMPASAAEFSGLVFMGGPMSVNDDLPWIPPALDLIQQAVAKDIPVLGHCLGGQLISKALGAKVGPNPVKEIGWGEVAVADHAEAKRWFGDVSKFQSFHWHGETFEVPAGATHLLSSTYCQNQAYSLGKHLAFQCHMEMTASMVKKWCVAGAAEIAASDSVGVQQPHDIQHDLTARIAELNDLAAIVYRQWIAGLKR